MGTRAEFDTLMGAIPDAALAERVRDSAITNAGDTVIEQGYRGELETPEFWEAAIVTAKLILDDPRAFYPELFPARR